jgi:hypothetical protein
MPPARNDGLITALRNILLYANDSFWTAKDQSRDPLYCISLDRIQHDGVLGFGKSSDAISDCLQALGIRYHNIEIDPDDSSRLRLTISTEGYAALKEAKKNLFHDLSLEDRQKSIALNTMLFSMGSADFSPTSAKLRTNWTLTDTGLYQISLPLSLREDNIITSCMRDIQLPSAIIQSDPNNKKRTLVNIYASQYPTLLRAMAEKEMSARGAGRA